MTNGDFIEDKQFFIKNFKRLLLPFKLKKFIVMHFLDHYSFCYSITNRQM